MIHGVNQAQRMKRAERLPKVMSLVKAGLRYAEIGRQLGISKQTVYSDVKKSLKTLAEENIEVTAEHVELQCARLDDMLLAVWAEARGGDLLAIDRALKIITLQARLRGALDAGTRTIHTGNQAIQINVEVLDDGKSTKRIDGSATELEDASKARAILPQHSEGGVVQRRLRGGQVPSPVHEAGSESEQTGSEGISLPEVPGEPSEHDVKDPTPTGGEATAGVADGDVRAPSQQQDNHD